MNEMIAGIKLFFFIGGGFLALALAIAKNHPIWSIPGLVSMGMAAVIHIAI